MKYLLLALFLISHSFADQKRDTLVFNTLEVDLLLVQALQEVVSVVYNSLGYEVIIKKFPAKRALYESQRHAHGELGRAKISPSGYGNLRLIDEPLLKFTVTIFTLRDKPALCSWDELSHRDIALMRGYPLLDSLTRSLEREFTNSTTNAFKMLMHERVDAVVSMPVLGYQTLKESGLEGHIIPCPEPIETLYVYHLLNNKYPELIIQFTHRVQLMRESGELQKITTEIENRIYEGIIDEMSIHYGIQFKIPHMYPLGIQK
ncbi:MAG: transporter substrate-binding domain-containing protein [Fibrobacterales bacterium]